MKLLEYFFWRIIITGEKKKAEGVARFQVTKEILLG